MPAWTTDESRRDAGRPRPDGLERLTWRYQGITSRCSARCHEWPNDIMPRRTETWCLLAAADEALERALLAEGFIREHRPGRLLRGYYHPAHPAYAFEHGSGPLFDGRADCSRLIRLAIHGQTHIILPSVEDMIADRLAQHEIASPTDDSRLRQARMLFWVTDALDHAYLLQRIGDEGGNPTLLEPWPDASG